MASKDRTVKQKIVSVDNGSIAEELGVKPGFSLLSINSEPVLDVVDYEYLTSASRLLIRFESDDGELVEARVEKETWEPLGLNFETTLMSRYMHCKNRCVFCFIDQMPGGIRDSLKVKDDDWRLSFIMGNYISLTNMDEAEFERMLKRHVSPLYISVHATNPDTRAKLMGNRQARNLYPRLLRLRDAGISFHCQIVLVPGYNDGEVLENTMKDLRALYPAASSVAVVPVGLTKYRDKLTAIRCLTQAEAASSVDAVEALQRKCKPELGTAFAFCADELYLLAGRELPDYESYEQFPQLENGVGLLRQFEHGFLSRMQSLTPLPSPVEFDAAGGMAAWPFLSELFSKLKGFGIHINLHPVVNSFLGETVTVGGLVCACDIISQLKGKLKTRHLIIPRNMLRQDKAVFLDGTTLEALESELEVKVHALHPYDGEEFLSELTALVSKR